MSLRKLLKRLLLALGMGVGAAAWAQPYTVDWSTLDAGGGTSTGGAFVLSGTVGQPDANPAPLVGGPFTLQGGFWPGLIVTVPGDGPTLLIQVSGGDVILSWSPATPGFELEETANLLDPEWSPTASGNPVTLPAGGSARFYRLRRP